MINKQSEKTNNSELANKLTNKSELINKLTDKKTNNSELFHKLLNDKKFSSSDLFHDLNINKINNPELLGNDILNFKKDFTYILFRGKTKKTATVVESPPKIEKPIFSWDSLSLENISWNKFFEFIKSSGNVKLTTTNPNFYFSENFLKNKCTNSNQFGLEEVISYKLFCISSLAFFTVCIFLMILIDGAQQQALRLKKIEDLKSSRNVKKDAHDYDFFLFCKTARIIKLDVTFKEHVEVIRPANLKKIAELRKKNANPEMDEFYKESKKLEDEKWRKKDEIDAKKPWYWW